jgi:TetR/AcrR family transcriptional regulator
MSEPAVQEIRVPAARRQPRMHADARRQHLIDQAIHLFAMLGFRGTTTKAIAQAAGVSEAVIFRHFATKDDLYGAMLRQKADKDGLDETLDALRDHAARGEDQELVARLVAHVLESHRRDPDFHRVMLYAALEGHDLAKAGEAYGLQLFGFLRDYVLERQRAGAFRAGDPALMVFALVALPVHFSIVARLFGVERPQGSDRQLTEEFTRTILDGLRAPQAPRPAGTERTKASRTGERPVRRSKATGARATKQQA